MNIGVEFLLEYVFLILVDIDILFFNVIIFFIILLVN